MDPPLVKAKQLHEWCDNMRFNPPHRDLSRGEKQGATAAVVKCLDNICRFFNSDLVHNADVLFSSRAIDTPFSWVGKTELVVQPQKSKVSGHCHLLGHDISASS